MTRHCSECWSLMKHRHGTFRRPGGYYCPNPNCPESPRFRYKHPDGKVLIAALKAHRLKQVISND